MCYQFYCKEIALITTKIHFSNEFSQHYWQESFDGDSFVSQSRFDTYANYYSTRFLYKKKAYKKMRLKWPKS